VRTSRFTRLAGISLATIVAAAALAACGSSAKTAAPPTTSRPKLSLAARNGTPEPALYPVRPVTYVFDGTPADLGTHAGVRTLTAHAVTDADVTRIADALGMRGTPQHTATGYELRDGDAQLTVDTSGGLTYVGYSRDAGGATSGGSTSGGSTGSGEPSTGAVTEPPVPGTTVPDASGPDVPVSELPVPGRPVTPMPTVPPTDTVTVTTPPPVDVPNADDAARIAQSLLDRFGVLAGNEWSHTVTDADGLVSSCGPTADCSAVPSPVSARAVMYHLVVDRHEVAGLDWSVTIGDHGRVDAVSGTWGDVQPAVDYPLRSTADAFADLQHGRARFPGPQPLAAAVAGESASPAPSGPSASEVHISGVDLGTARWDGFEHARAVVYLLPTYRFHTSAAGIPPYDIEVLALDPASFDLAPNTTSAGQEVEK
jgi:hypothetical protein